MHPVDTFIKLVQESAEQLAQADITTDQYHVLETMLNFYRAHRLTSGMYLTPEKIYFDMMLEYANVVYNFTCSYAVHGYTIERIEKINRLTDKLAEPLCIP